MDAWVCGWRGRDSSIDDDFHRRISDMKILIVGGDTEALAASFVLSSVVGNDVTVVSPFADPNLAPYPNGAVRQHGDGPELRATLDYFELGCSEYEFRNSLLRAPGKLERMPINNNVGIDTKGFYKRSRGVSDALTPARLGINATFADTEQLALASGLRFDIKAFHARLHEYASPEVGKLESLGPNAATFSTPSGSLLVCGFDSMLDMRVPPDGISYSRLLHVRAPALSLDLGATYPLCTKMIHRVTSYGNGDHVCELANLGRDSVIFNDMSLIFPDGYNIARLGIRVPSYVLPGWAPIQLQNVRRLGKWAELNPRLTLAATMESAKEQS